MYWTPDRLLLIADVVSAAVVMTLLSVGGGYRAWRQRAEARIGTGLFATYVGLLATGSSLAWFGFFVGWLQA